MQNSDRFTRFSALIGEGDFEKIKSRHVLLFGVGGVGSYVAEALVRSGVGKISVVDFDTVSESNINRQLIALTSTVGKNKAEVMRERLLEINPECRVEIYKTKVTPENVDTFFGDKPDYVADAIDDVPAKLAVVLHCREKGIPLISAMGTGNKLHPELLTVADISKTEVCPLCRSVRRQLRQAGVESGVKVVFSKETPLKSPLFSEGRPVPGSFAPVPATAGLRMAAEILRAFTEDETDKYKMRGK